MRIYELFEAIPGIENIPVMPPAAKNTGTNPSTPIGAANGNANVASNANSNAAVNTANVPSGPEAARAFPVGKVTTVAVGPGKTEVPAKIVGRQQNSGNLVVSVKNSPVPLAMSPDDLARAASVVQR